MSIVAGIAIGLWIAICLSRPLGGRCPDCQTRSHTKGDYCPQCGSELEDTNDRVYHGLIRQLARSTDTSIPRQTTDD